jgi:hypothetical protein
MLDQELKTRFAQTVALRRRSLDDGQIDPQ